VAVEPPARSNVAAAPVLLRAGDQLDHRAGTRLWMVSHVDPETAFAWKRGELVYNDRPLADVVSDLNRYVDAPIQVAAPAASLRFSGVLRIDDEAAMIRRLEAFLPVEAARTDAGLVLNLRDSRG
jgi:transmembrane sensor